MIKYLFLPILVCMLFVSFNKAEAQEQLNIKADNILMKVFETGDVVMLDAIIATDFVNHAENDKVGLDSLKQMVKGFHSNVKNLKMEIVTQMANDNYVCDWVRFTGNNPEMVIEGMEVTRYANGLAQEHWFFPKNQNRGN
tara:strand:+ start:15235 stop:15654 length:420 start_codon:yes stop_codon:yes gene_type:complete